MSRVALNQPHVAFAAYVHGQASKWTYISRTISGIGHLLKPLEQAIQEKLIPGITGCPSCSNIERSLLALPARLGGLGLTILSSKADHSFKASSKITAPVAAVICSSGI